MPMLAFDETDLLEFFCVEPKTGEHGIWQTYSVTKDGITLEFTVYPYDSEVILLLRREHSTDSLFRAHIVGSEGIKLRRDKVPTLEVAPGGIFSYRFDSEYTIPYGFELSLEPDFRLWLFAK